MMAWCVNPAGRGEVSMSSTPSPTQTRFSEGRWVTEPSVDAPLQPSDLDQVPNPRPSFGKRASRALVRFLITFCIGVATVLAWQSYGNAAREMIASSFPWLGWLAPQAEPIAQSAPAAPSPDQEQLKAMLFGLAGVRQRVDQIAAQIAAGQEQMTRDITTKLQAAEQDILDKITAPPLPSSPTAAPARKPVPPQVQPVR
jgi:hypothetical protein